MLPELLGVAADHPDVKDWGEKFLGVFLIGGTIGGWLFSSLADKCANQRGHPQYCFARKLF